MEFKNKVFLSSLILFSSLTNLEANIIDKLKGKNIDLYAKKYDILNEIHETNYQITSAPIPKYEFKHKINNFYSKMKDVKYVFGGASMDGIDCSAFIRKFYQDEFNVKLTRSTHTQVYEGIPIARDELKLGDLIFFKEKNRVSNHVGIYIGNGKML